MNLFLPDGVPVAVLQPLAYLLQYVVGRAIYNELLLGAFRYQPHWPVAPWLFLRSTISLNFSPVKDYGIGDVGASVNSGRDRIVAVAPGMSLAAAAAAGE